MTLVDGVPFLNLKLARKDPDDLARVDITFYAFCGGQRFGLLPTERLDGDYVKEPRTYGYMADRWREVR